MQTRQDKFRSVVLTKNGFAFWLALIVSLATSAFQVLADGPPAPAQVGQTAQFLEVR